MGADRQDLIFPLLVLKVKRVSYSGSVWDNKWSVWPLMSHENSKAAVRLHQQLEIQTEQENEKTTEQFHWLILLPRKSFFLLQSFIKLEKLHIGKDCQICRIDVNTSG